MPGVIYTDGGGHFHSKKIVWFHKTITGYEYIKIALLFFLSIYSWCGVPASWATRYTTMCLDSIKIRNYSTSYTKRSDLYATTTEH